jgi:hypothetical protein
MGRPSKLTPETQQKIAQAVASGNYFDTAAAYGGISYDTFNDWMNKGINKVDAKYVQFYHAIKKAEADAEVMRVARISKAGQEGNWQADAWQLERRYPQKWGRRVSEVNGPEGGPLEVVVKVTYDRT